MRIYTLRVFLISGRIGERFAKRKAVISRIIQIRGDQTLQDLHQAIFDAFDRRDHRIYEFQFWIGPMDSAGLRYVLPTIFEIEGDEGKRPAGRVDQTTIASLGLEVGRSFGYWFDFGDDRWHQIDVMAIENKLPSGKYPKVTRRFGKSPPQYIDE